MGFKKILPFFFFLSSILTPLFPQDLAYTYLMEMGLRALKELHYEDAIHYFALAHLVEPSSEVPLKYLNFILKQKEDNKNLTSVKGKESEEETYRNKTTSTLEEDRRRIINEFLDIFEKGSRKEEVKEEKFLSETKKPEEKKGVLANRLILTDELWATQPKTSLEIEAGGDLIVEGKNIARFLIVSPGFIEVERIDPDRIRIVAKSLGSTFFYLWEERGRWTFNVKVNPPKPTVSLEEKKNLEEFEPFKFFYNNDWRSYSRGRRLRNLERKNLTFDESAGIYGQTPYGEMDASLSWSKLKDSYKVNDYTLGLTEGIIGFLKDFNLRVFDFNKDFSALSFPGESLEGFLWEQSIAGKTIDYSLLWGKERWGFYGYLSPGVAEERDSYIEGAKITLFSQGKDKFSLNYAHGYGSDREDYLKDKVYSFESEHNLDNLHILTEVAHDEDSVAGYLNSSFDLGDFRLRLNFRDIEKDFTTITGRPPDQGEIGALLGFDWKFSDNISFSSTWDVYRDRYLYNEGKPHEINIDYEGRLDFYLSPYSSFSTTIFYYNEPGLISPRKDINLQTTYSHNFKIFNEKSLYTFLGWMHQRSRNPLSLSSDFDVDKIFGGLRLSLTQNLYYYLNYSYNWLKERLEAQRSSPSVMETGINYSQNLMPALSMDLNFYYRDEQEAKALHSFLSGEDSIEGSLRFTYTPWEDLEVFIDGRVRNVWAENPAVEKYMEAEVRFGVRSSWELPFVWNPQAEVYGFVFKDLNGNGLNEKGEEPLEGVRIKVGKKVVSTDKDGFFLCSVRGKKITVSVDPESIPPGYVLTTPSSQELEITQGKKFLMNFGVTTQGGIYGIVFLDRNLNGKFDAQDVGIPQVKIYLNEEVATFTDSQGKFFFGGLTQGRHTLKIDINTVPLQYLPLKPLKEEITLSEGERYILDIPFKEKKETKVNNK